MALKVLFIYHTSSHPLDLSFFPMTFTCLRDRLCKKSHMLHCFLRSHLICSLLPLICPISWTQISRLDWIQGNYFSPILLVMLCSSRSTQSQGAWVAQLVKHLFDSRFWLGSWSQCWQHRACLGFSLSFSLPFPTLSVCLCMCMRALSLK